VILCRIILISVTVINMVARWPHGCRRQCSEVAVPALVGFESHRRGRIFSNERTSAGPWMCVYVFQGLTVGWWKEERHSSDTTARSAGFKSQAAWASHGCLCCISCQKERVGVGGRGKYPGAPPHLKKRKERADRQVPDRPVR
jgi:hypothetical protein